jgi:hypothetical protein
MLLVPEACQLGKINVNRLAWFAPSLQRKAADEAKAPALLFAK